MKKTSKRQIISKLLLVGLAFYLLIGSIEKFKYTKDSGYLIFPSIIFIFILWELYYQYFRSGDKK